MNKLNSMTSIAALLALSVVGVTTHVSAAVTTTETMPEKRLMVNVVKLNVVLTRERLMLKKQPTLNAEQIKKQPMLNAAQTRKQPMLNAEQTRKRLMLNAVQARKRLMLNVAQAKMQQMVNLLLIKPLKYR